jgi:hypothetical protein
VKKFSSEDLTNFSHNYDETRSIEEKQFQYKLINRNVILARFDKGFLLKLIMQFAAEYSTPSMWFLKGFTTLKCVCLLWNRLVTIQDCGRNPSIGKRKKVAVIIDKFHQTCSHKSDKIF